MSWFVKRQQLKKNRVYQEFLSVSPQAVSASTEARQNKMSFCRSCELDETRNSKGRSALKRDRAPLHRNPVTKIFLRNGGASVAIRPKPRLTTTCGYTSTAVQGPDAPANSNDVSAGEPLSRAGKLSKIHVGLKLHFSRCNRKHFFSVFFPWISHKNVPIEPSYRQRSVRSR